jgi:hypothetical protein
MMEVGASDIASVRAITVGDNLFIGLSRQVRGRPGSGLLIFDPFSK